MMSVLLDSEAIWESFITTDYVRKIVTSFLVVEFKWSLLSPFKFLRGFIVFILLGMGVLPIGCQTFVDCLTVGPDGDMWGVLVVESHLSQIECGHHCSQFHLICVCSNRLVIE
jgi:hypothetical protein